ncbi:MAG: YkgJ family cysteine cluster protein [Faecalibacterium sp.]
MRDKQIDLCGQVDFVRGKEMPLLERDACFTFACNDCGGCCRGREDIVLSGYDLYRIAGRLRLPPRIVARGFCRGSIGAVSHLPVLRLAPVKEERNNCPFLSGTRCSIHDAEPLVCALYPLAQEITREGEVRWFVQPTDCGGHVTKASVQDYLLRYDLLEREPVDVRWAQCCMELEDRVEALEAQLEPVLRKRMQARLWQVLYYGYDPAQPYLPQLEQNLAELDRAFEVLMAYQINRKK